MGKLKRAHGHFWVGRKSLKLDCSNGCTAVNLQKSVNCALVMTESVVHKLHLNTGEAMLATHLTERLRSKHIGQQLKRLN